MKKYILHREPHPVRVDYDRDLNEEQRAAVMHQSGPALVLAGAGTGKTRVVTYRVARLIETGTAAENILLLTFTNKAAREMMRRVENLIGRNVYGLTGGTFHHVGNLLLRQHAELAGYGRGFSILDREDGKELFDSCAVELYKKDTLLPKGTVLAEICSLSKNTGTPVAGIIVERFPYFVSTVEEIGNVVSLYEKKKGALNLMDFDDLLLNWKRVFEENDRIREYYGLKFRHILVDEYQDTNRLQAEIVDLTAGGEKNLMVVGDDAQSIYSFRGADFENIIHFPEKYADTSIFKLTTNYRSTPEILALANGIISRNAQQFRKELHAVAGPGDLPCIVPLRDGVEQAEFVSSVMMDLNMDGMSLDEIAVLYRSHYQSMELQMELQRRGIPFEVRSGLKFFELAHIKDVLSFLKITANDRDEISWKRILKLNRGIGNITAGKVWKFIASAERPRQALSGAAAMVPKKAREVFGEFSRLIGALDGDAYAGSPSEAIQFILKEGYEEYLHGNFPNADMRIEDIEQMVRFASRYESMDQFLADMTLQGLAEADSGTGDDSAGRVVLSTVHQAKGLEWKTVFIVGLNDGRFPSAKSLRSGGEEEERRLFYVGVTRARESLYLCYLVTVDDWNGRGFVRPSRFLRELPSACCEEISVEDA